MEILTTCRVDRCQCLSTYWRRCRLNNVRLINLIVSYYQQVFNWSRNKRFGSISVIWLSRVIWLINRPCELIRFNWWSRLNRWWTVALPHPARYSQPRSSMSADKSRSHKAPWTFRRWHGDGKTRCPREGSEQSTVYQASSD